jgi:ribosome-associated protein
MIATAPRHPPFFPLDPMRSPSRRPDDAAPLAERPSKSALKREMHDLQDLGEALAALPAERLAAAPMPESLRDAIVEYKRTRSHEGRRRQMQYVGKLIRQADAGPLREAVAAFKLPSAQATLQLHQAEAWRVQLVADDEALTRFAAEFPGADLQQLRSLVRAARRDAALPPEQRHGRAWRELFQFIKPWLLDQGDESDDTDEHDDEHRSD